MEGKEPEIVPTVVKEVKNNKKETEPKLEEPPPSLPEEVSEALGEMPDNIKRQVTMAMMQMTTRQGSIHPLFDKFTEAHVDKFLDYSQKDDENEYKLKSSNRWFYLIYFLVALAFMVFLIMFLLPNNKELLVDFIKILVGFVGGFGAGYGLKTKLSH